MDTLQSQTYMLSARYNLKPAIASFWIAIVSNLMITAHSHFLFFILTQTEAHRALELLEDYHSRLGGPQDRALRIAIERVIRIFKSRLFQALLGE